MFYAMLYRTVVCDGQYHITVCYSIFHLSIHKEYKTSSNLAWYKIAWKYLHIVFIWPQSTILNGRKNSLTGIQYEKKSLVQLTYGLNVPDEEHQGGWILEVYQNFVVQYNIISQWDHDTVHQLEGYKFL